MSKAQNDIPSKKRDGHDMTMDVRDTVQLDERKSSIRATSTLRQEMLLNKLEKDFEEDEEGVVAHFEKLRSECTDFVICELIIVIKVERMRVNVIADVLGLGKPVSIWENFLPSTKVLTYPTLLISATTPRSDPSRKGHPY